MTFFYNPFMYVVFFFSNPFMYVVYTKIGLSGQKSLRLNDSASEHPDTMNQTHAYYIDKSQFKHIPVRLNPRDKKECNKCCLKIPRGESNESVLDPALKKRYDCQKPVNCNYNVLPLDSTLINRPGGLKMYEKVVCIFRPVMLAFVLQYHTVYRFFVCKSIVSKMDSIENVTHYSF